MNLSFASDEVLLCFAVKEEAVYARSLTSNILITGMGSANARRTVEAILTNRQPRIVLSCGFAGGLNPAMQSGDVVFEAEDPSELSNALKNAGARHARFHFSPHIVSTAREKRELWDQTRAEAVEMESHVIREVCQSHGLPCATVRVISDAADEDLPLDFNRCLDSNQNLRMGKLLAAVAASPWKIPALLRLQRTTREAARQLATVLARIIRT